VLQQPPLSEGLSVPITIEGSSLIVDDLIITVCEPVYAINSPPKADSAASCKDHLDQGGGFLSKREFESYGHATAVLHLELEEQVEVAPIS
jgi:hypothetical protein